MNYVCTDARFLFFDGKSRYTVEYTYGLATWYIFKDRHQTDAVFWKEDKTIKLKSVNSDNAENILYEYLESL